VSVISSGFNLQNLEVLLWGIARAWNTFRVDNENRIDYVCK